jgi:hypothetical protein
MTDSIVPNWIKEIEASDRLKATAENASALEDVLTEKTIQTDGPTYWKQLQKELHIAVEGLKRIGISGAISVAFAVQQKGIQVKLYRTDRPARQDYVNLFYNDGEAGIWRYPATPEGVSKFPFDVIHGNVVLFGDADALNPEQAVRFILEPMVKSIKA